MQYVFSGFVGDKVRKAKDGKNMMTLNKTPTDEVNYEYTESENATNLLDGDLWISYQGYYLPDNEHLKGLTKPYFLLLNKKAEF
jgi:hypothetical protein